jgi:hypothetical protein
MIVGWRRRRRNLAQNMGTIFSLGLDLTFLIRLLLGLALPLTLRATRPEDGPFIGK